MAAQKKPVAPEVLAAARARAAEVRQKLGPDPGRAEVVTAGEVADGAPFYFALRAFIHALKQAREALGLTLADVSAASGIAVESLSRLETGASTNPTWKTLGSYAGRSAGNPS